MNPIFTGFLASLIAGLATCENDTPKFLETDQLIGVATGSSTLKIEPSPNRLLTEIEPPQRNSNCWTIVNPKPAPVLSPVVERPR